MNSYERLQLADEAPLTDCACFTEGCEAPAVEGWGPHCHGCTDQLREGGVCTVHGCDEDGRRAGR